MAYRLKGFILGLILFGPLLLIMNGMMAGVAAVSTGEIDGRCLTARAATPSGLGHASVSSCKHDIPIAGSVR